MMISANSNTTRYAQANGMQLAYETFGAVENPAVLLIHGLATQMLAWPTPLCESLAAAGFYVIRFDNRDIGLSTSLDAWGRPRMLWLFLQSWLGIVPRVAYTLVDMADDAFALMDVLQLQRAHIVGASMGGMIAQHMAVMQPMRVQTLTCIMSSSGARSLPEARDDIQKLMSTSIPDGDQEAAMQQMFNFWKAIASPEYPPEDRELRTFVEACTARCVPGGINELRHLAAIIADGSREALLQHIKTPTLVIHGEADPLLPMACGVDIAHHVPNAKLELINGMGHDLPMPLLDQLCTLLTNHFNQSNGELIE
ncbi:MAG: alpha/beta hydrolase [Cyanobacteria bacterium P01_F01_bin.150]